MNIPQWIVIAILLLTVVLAVAGYAIYKDARRSKRLVQELLQESVSRLSTAPADTRATLFRVRNDGTLSIYGSTDSEYNQAEKFRIPLNSTAAGEAWLKSRPVARNFTTKQIKSLNASKEPLKFAARMRSTLAIPLQDSSGRVIGILSLDSRYPLQESGLGKAERIKIGRAVADLISKALVEFKPPERIKHTSEITASGESKQ